MTRGALLPPPWAFRDFGTGPILVTQHGGAKVILAARGSKLVVRDAEGRLVPLTFDHPLVPILEAAPDLLLAAKVVLAGLHARIDAAPGDALPVFEGIAALDAAIRRMEGRA